MTTFLSSDLQLRLRGNKLRRDLRQNNWEIGFSQENGRWRHTVVGPLGVKTPPKEKKSVKNE